MLQLKWVHVFFFLYSTEFVVLWLFCSLLSCYSNGIFVDFLPGTANVIIRATSTRSDLFHVIYPFQAA